MAARLLIARTVPSGSYLHVDPVDGAAVAVEDFQCAAGPAGWRYVGVVRESAGGAEVGRVDVTVDGGGRQVRVELAGGGWRLRGGVAGRNTLWVRSPEEPRRGLVGGMGGAASGTARPDAAGAAGSGSTSGEQVEEATGFAGRSPAFLVAATRLMRLTPGGRARLRLIHVSDPALGTVAIEQGWHLAGVLEHPTELGALPVARYDLADLGTGQVSPVHVAGDVVLAGPGTELAELRSPPTLSWT